MCNCWRFHARLVAALWLALVALASRAAGQADRFGDALPPHAVARLGTIRFRHGRAVQDLAFAPDSKTLASLHAGGEVVVWDIPSGKPLHRLVGASSSGPLWSFALNGGAAQIRFAADGKSVVFLSDRTPTRWTPGMAKTQPWVNTWVLNAAPAKVTIIDGLKPPVPEPKKLPAKPEFERLAQTPILSPRGSYLLATTETHHELWDAEPKRLAGFALPERAAKYLTSQRPFVAAFSADETQLAVLIDKESILLYDIETRTEKHLRGHQGPCAALAFSPDGKTLICAGEFFHEWDLTTLKLRRRVEVGPERDDIWRGWLNPKEPPAKIRPMVAGLAFAPDGKRLAVSVDNDLTLWDAATLKPTWSAPNGFGGFAFSPGGKYLAVSRDYGRLQLLDTVSGRSLCPDLDAADIGSLSHFHSRGRTLVATPANRYLLGDLSDSKKRQHVQFEEWNPLAGVRLRRVRYPVTDLDNVVFTPDGRRATTQGGRKEKGKFLTEIALWDASAGKRLRELAPITLDLPKEEDAVLARYSAGPSKMLALADAGNRLAFVGGDKVSVWNLDCPDRTPAFTLDCHDDKDGKSGNWYIASVVFSPDGKVLKVRRSPRVYAVIGIVRRRMYAPTEVRFYDAETGKRLPLFQDQDRREMTFERYCHWSSYSPDSRLLATDYLQSSYGLQLWDARRGTLMHTLAKDREVDHVAFAPDGRSLAVADEKGRISLWECATGGMRVEWIAHAGDLRGLRFMPDGKHLLSQGPEGAVLVWDLYNLRPPHQLQVPGARLPWQDLTEPDAIKGYHAMTPFLDRPKETVAFLRTRLVPVPLVSGKQIETWLADLGSSQFIKREQAMQALRNDLEVTYDALLDAKGKANSLEVARRIDQLLDDAPTSRLHIERFRIGRAVEILEQIGDAEAVAILRAAAKGEPQAHLTQCSRAALERIERLRE